MSCNQMLNQSHFIPPLATTSLSNPRMQKMNSEDEAVQSQSELKLID